MRLSYSKDSVYRITKRETPMTLTILLIIFGILFILALLFIVATDTTFNRRSTQKYQEHIADLVQQLFPPATDQALTDTIQAPTVQQIPTIKEVDQWREEAKDKMVAEIRRYFNQRKIDAAIADTPVRSHEELTYPTPPSIQRILE